MLLHKPGVGALACVNVRFLGELNMFENTKQAASAGVGSRC